MAYLILSLGSNVNAENNIGLAIAALRQEYGELSLSTVYESEAVGFSGDNFLNLTATVECNKSLAEIITYLKQLEDSLGRDRSQTRFSDRTIDVDILIYGNETGEDCGLSLPRSEILENTFVLKPLAEMHPNLQFPDSGRTYQEFWDQFDQDSQKLWATEITY
ncbi:MAG: 2-amino-4-hydroxy-6-hydroxymethyldihydropteridine diphosphokinase [Pseudomonadales bacterium]|nr:2-amino-4-hydroxy-6-hydroxymethyldihydropteridine diphosphokinase [Pseudomonadales bacterium]